VSYLLAVRFGESAKGFLWNTSGTYKLYEIGSAAIFEVLRGRIKSQKTALEKRFGLGKLYETHGER
jgi:hypothetical protein